MSLSTPHLSARLLKADDKGLAVARATIMMDWEAVVGAVITRLGFKVTDGNSHPVDGLS